MNDFYPILRKLLDVLFPQVNAMIRNEMRSQKSQGFEVFHRSLPVPFLNFIQFACGLSHMNDERKVIFKCKFIGL